MIIIWRGVGLLALVLPFALAVSAQIIAEKYLGATYNQSHAWPLSSGYLVGGLILWAMGRVLNKSKGKILSNMKTDLGAIAKQSHNLWGVPIEYFGILWLVIGIAVLFSR